jgi:hypothetical protein
LTAGAVRGHLSGMHLHGRSGFIVLLAAAATLAGCQSANPSGPVPRPGPGAKYGQGDGQTMATAVEIRTNSEAQGEALIRDWIERHYPGFRIQQVNLVEHRGRAYNLVTLTSPVQATRHVYFDISAFHRVGGDNLPKPMS